MGGYYLIVLVGHGVLADLLPVMCRSVGGRGDADGGEKGGEDGLDLGSVCLHGMCVL